MPESSIVTLTSFAAAQAKWRKDESTRQRRAANGGSPRKDINKLMLG